MSIRSFLLLAALALALPAAAQISLTGSYYQTFDGLGTAPQAELPGGWRVDTFAEVDAIGFYEDARTRTDARGGNLFGQGAPTGLINFGSGPAASATDRAVGFATDGGFGSGVVYGRFRNDTGAALQTVWYALSREMYRGGGDEVEVELSVLYSFNGRSWYGGQGSSLASGGDRDGYADAPADGFSRNVSPLTPYEPIGAGEDFYIAFLYTAADGAPVAQIPAMAFDEFAIATSSGGLSAIFPSHGERVFGDVPVGQTSAPQSLTANVVAFGSSDEPAVEITGPDASDFAAEVTSPFGVDYDVTFTPSGPGPRQATLRFVLDGFATWSVALRGGTEAEAGEIRMAAELREGQGAIPAGGGRYRYKVLARARGGAPQTVDLWADLVWPTGRVVPALRPEAVTVTADGLFRTAENRRVRSQWPAGTYTHRVYLGTYPDGVLAEASFTVEKAASATALAASVTSPEGPNPFRDRTVVRFEGVGEAQVRAELFDTTGRLVGVLFEGVAPDALAVTVEGRDLPAGVYVVRLTGGGVAEARTVVRAR